ncbi:hypothetical protein UA08_01867 [Talaromyces atroroseus]|uniref:Uncharacterized protein n=1 Tax=Talaromyces atroroseus TaxID=1441469 RepID=A0A1Q5QBG6_TALAT|nr:hypothetical protein UA08_01867 [Talaromyces atroroseus]OKL63283.1 hypothetical protein UA08_01867 [Talaromyces atroroseus]
MEDRNFAVGNSSSAKFKAGGGQWRRQSVVPVLAAHKCSGRRYQSRRVDSTGARNSGRPFVQGMASQESVPTSSLLATEESRYRTEVLLLQEDETEENLEERLVAEASQLGLKIPDIHIAASLAATINAGFLDVSVSSAGSTRTRPSLTHPHTFADLVRSSVVSFDQLPGSLSETTLSDRGHSGSIPSIDSFSTRPTSISSCDIRIIPPSAQHERQSQHQIPSPSSTSSGTRLTERKRSSFINALGRPFRKRRTPSAVNLPPNAHISLKKHEAAAGRGAATSTVLVETKPLRSTEADHPEGEAQGQGVTLQVEVPVFDEAALQRSMDDAQLKSLFERHREERSRFVRLQNELLDSLKEAHLVVIAERKRQNAIAEKEKQEQNNGYISRMEERQLSVEIDQMKEFQKTKRNSQTRIKYMEGYVSTSSPPQSPVLSGRESRPHSACFEPIPRRQSQASYSSDGGSQQPQYRIVTRRQKEQLAQEYLDRDSMDRLHEARIKVLRERQEQRLQETTARLERELEMLVHKNAETIGELERDHQRAEQEMLRVFEAKKHRLRRRWNIEEAILRTKLEHQNGVPYGPLPIISFSVPDHDEDSRALLDRDIPILKNPFASS